MAGDVELAQALSYARDLKALYETPELPDDASHPPDRERVKRIIEKARSEGRTILN